jgi:hypothetical protein
LGRAKRLNPTEVAQYMSRNPVEEEKYFSTYPVNARGYEDTLISALGHKYVLQHPEIFTSQFNK